MKIVVDYKNILLNCFDCVSCNRKWEIMFFKILCSGFLMNLVMVLGWLKQSLTWIIPSSSLTWH